MFYPTLKGKTMITETLPEQIAKHYSSAMDSVNLINARQPEGTTDEDWADTVLRNKEHLRIMLAKDYWTTEDLTPIQDAVG
jgi:hypothetical protein